MNLLSLSHISLRNQVNWILALEKKKGGLFAKYFLAALKPVCFIWANCKPRRIQRGNSSAQQTAQALDCSRVMSSTNSSVMSPTNSYLSVSESLTASSLRGKSFWLLHQVQECEEGKETASWGLPLGFSHRLRLPASFYLLDSVVIFHETTPTGQESRDLFLI